MEEKRHEDLEQALVDLAAGQDANQLITTHPEVADEIETAQWAQSLAELPMLDDAAHRSRTRVLARAHQLRTEVQTRSWRFPRLPRLAYALALVFFFLLSWNGLLIASAQALPGDQLYPAKLTLERLRLGWVLNPQTHQEVEEEYQARRADEVESLLVLGRIEFVQFHGVVEEQADDFWIVGGIEVHLLPETIIIGDILPGMRVEVEGATQPEGWVQASELHLQDFTFNGTVEMISTEMWSIAGRDVLITSDSSVDPEIKIGDLVNVEVTSDDFGTLTARSITLLTTIEQGPISTETPLPLTNTPSKQPDPTSADLPTEVDEPDETDEQDEMDESEEEDETDEPDEPDETAEPDETDEP